jgi:hypothetical protein
MMLSLILLLASVAFSAPSPALSTTTTAEVAAVERPQTLGEYVREYYADTPILADIAWCESRLRQLGPDGKIFRGVANPDDVGVMQVNTRYHEEQAVSMNMDLFTLNGNLAYAKYLYKKEGSTPWASSKACWAKTVKK